MAALRHFYNELGDRIWGDYGFVDAFSETRTGTPIPTWRSTRGRSS